MWRGEWKREQQDYQACAWGVLRMTNLHLATLKLQDASVCAVDGWCPLVVGMACTSLTVNDSACNSCVAMVGTYRALQCADMIMLYITAWHRL